MGEIRSAVVGTGFIGAVHAEALRRLGVEVLGVVGSSPERAAAKRPPGVRRAYESLEALLAEPDVDVVHITTPNYLHADGRGGDRGRQARRLREAAGDGLAPRAELCALARASGLVHASTSTSASTRSRARRGSWSPPAPSGDLRLYGAYLQDWLLKATDWNWRLEPDLGGDMRAVADIGSHWIDLTRFISGQDVDRGLRRLRDVRACSQEAAQAGRDVRRQTRRPRRTTRSARSAPRTTPASSSASRMRRARRADRLAGERRPQEPQRLRDQRRADASIAWHSERVEELWLGHRDRPSEVAAQGSVGDVESPARSPRPPGGHAEGFATPSRCSTARSTRRRGGRSAGAAGLPDVRGRRLRRRWARRSESAHEQRWVRRRPHPGRLGRFDMKLGSLRRPFRACRCRRWHAGRPTNGFETLEIACWPAGKAERGDTRASATSMSPPQQGRARRDPRAAGRARPRDLLARLLPEPARTPIRGRARPPSPTSRR